MFNETMLKTAGNRNSTLEIELPNASLQPGLDSDLIYLSLKVSSGVWIGSEIEQYVHRYALNSFLMDLLEVKSNPAHAAGLQAETDMLYLRIAGDGKTELWIYGHVEAMDHRTKLQFSFETQHQELGLNLDVIRKLGIV